MSSHVPPDAELYVAWCANEQHAGHELVRRHVRPLRRFFACKVRDRETAADLVQVTLEKLVKDRHRLTEPARFRAFLFGIAWNVLKNYYRQHGRERLRFIGDEELDLTCVTLDQIGIPLAIEHSPRDLLVHALHRVPIESQQMLMLFFKERMKYDEIAEVFEIPAGTVASRLSTARRQLEQAMATLELTDERLSSSRESFSAWAVEVQANLGKPALGGLIPHKLGGWRLVQCTIESDAVQGRYRKLLHQPVVELEVRRAPTRASTGAELDTVSIHDREWIRQRDQGRQEYVLRHLVGGRELRLVHRPATTWDSLVEVAGRLDLDQLATASF